MPDAVYTCCLDAYACTVAAKAVARGRSSEGVHCPPRVPHTLHLTNQLTLLYHTHVPHFFTDSHLTSPHTTLFHTHVTRITHITSHRVGQYAKLTNKSVMGNLEVLWDLGACDERLGGVRGRRLARHPGGEDAQLGGFPVSFGFWCRFSSGGSWCSVICVPVSVRNGFGGCGGLAAGARAVG